MTKLSTTLLKDLPIKQTSITDDDYVVVSSGGTKKLKVKDITKDVEKKAADLEEKTLELGSQLETKANDTELDVERKRIDNIIAVKDSTDNLETADIRIGADGNNYSSAGTAVRTQIGNIRNNFGCGANKFNPKFGIKATRVDTTNGKLVSNFPYQFASHFIKIEGQLLYIKNYANSPSGSFETVGSVVFYSSENENSFISGVTNTKMEGYEIPSEANYLRFSFGSTNGEVLNTLMVDFENKPIEDYYITLNNSKYVTETRVNEIIGDISSSIKSAYSLNVTNFGAKGDSITDDTVAIQSALDKAHELGGATVFIPSGIYFITNSLNVYSNTTILGENKWKSIIQLDPTKTGVPLLNCSGTSESDFKENIVVEHIHLKHYQGTNGVSSKEGANCLIFAKYIKMSTFRDNVMSKFAHCGIYLSYTIPKGATWSVNVKDNIIFNDVMQNLTSGIKLEDLAEYCEVSGNRVQYALTGIDITNSANNRILNNTVSSEQVGIKYRHTDASINGGKCLIVNNSVNHCSGGGIYIEEMCSSSILKQGGCIVNDNMILLPNNYGIKVLGGVGHVVNGNRIITSQVVDPAIYLGDNDTHKASYCLIQGNSAMCNINGSTGLIDISSATGEGNNADNNMLVVNN